MAKFIAARQQLHHSLLFFLYISLAAGIIGYLVGSTTHPTVQAVYEKPTATLEQKLETKSTTTATSLPPEKEKYDEPARPHYFPTKSQELIGKFAYVFYVTQAPYYCGALVNAHQLIQLGKNPNIDIIILTSAHFQPPPQQRETAERDLKIIHMTSDVLPLGEFDTSNGKFSGYYADSMVKLSVFSLYEQEYTRIIFLDSDSLVLKSLDEILFAFCEPCCTESVLD